MEYVYKIFPAIGIARVGNSQEYYLAPESSGGLPILCNGKDFQESDFRDGQEKLRRQGCRFRIYRYKVNDRNAAPEEVIVGEGEIAEGITWTVRLANKKSNWYKFATKNGENGYAPNHPLRNPHVTGDCRKNLVIDPGSRTLTNGSQSVYFDRKFNPDGYNMMWPPETLYPLDPDPNPLYCGTPHTINSLGEAHTDEQGNLIVVGGFGRAGSSDQYPESDDYANNDKWWDDTSDGPISATVLVDGNTINVSPAWVLVAPPAYAPEIVNLVTLYDSIFDVAVRHMGASPEMYENGFWKPEYQPNYYEEIKPILDRASMLPWIVAIPPKPHTFDSDLLGNPDPKYNNMRQYFFDQIRPPNQKNTFKSPKTGYPMMPYQVGDDAFGSEKSAKYCTLTHTQYFLLGQWVQGKFINNGKPSPKSDLGEQLTRAALENCVGEPFCPGIEMSWICRNPKLYTEPFRIKHKQMEPMEGLSLGINLDAGMEPGDVTKFMALPWQADFNECSTETIDRIVWWWPAQRPYFVYLRPRTLEMPISEETIQHQQAPWVGTDDETIQHQQVPWVGTDYDQTAADYVMFANNLEMVNKWDQLGFVFNINTKEDPYFVEVARILPRD